MEVDWLTRRVTVEEAEAAHLVSSDRLGPKPVPFGFQNARWQELLSEMREGDELWHFSSPPKTWASLSGRAGYAVVRRGRVVASIVTLRN
jgi:hypothetical protein